MGPRARLVTAPAGNGNGLWSVTCSLLHHLDFTMIQGIKQAGISFCRGRLKQSELQN